MLKEAVLQDAARALAAVGVASSVEFVDLAPSLLVPLDDSGGFDLEVYPVQGGLCADVWAHRGGLRIVSKWWLDSAAELPGLGGWLLSLPKEKLRALEDSGRESWRGFETHPHGDIRGVSKRGGATQGQSSEKFYRPPFSPIARSS